MANEKLRVAIIGTGMIANAAHIPAWKALSADVEVVAGADILPDRARAVAEANGIPYAYGDWEKMLKEVQPDVVSVCTANCYHKEQTIAALQAGAHVLCEKPVATNAADAGAMFDAAEKAGRTLLVGQSSRFTNRSFAAKEIVDAGRLGQVYYAETQCMRRRGIPKWGQFHMKEHSAGGPVYDLGVHAIDLLFWLIGGPRVKAVSGMTYLKFGNRDEGLATSLADSGAPTGVLTPRPYDYREYDVEDMASGYIRLEGDITVVFRTSWAANVPKYLGQTMILGTEGGLTLDPLTLTTNMDRYQADVTPTVPAERAASFPGHFGETAHLVRVIRGEEQPLVTRAQALNVMRTLDALYESARLGREVVVD